MGWGTGRYPATRTTRITACALARAIRMTMMTTGIWSSRTRNTPGQGASVWGGANQLAANATSTASASYSEDPPMKRSIRHTLLVCALTVSCLADQSWFNEGDGDPRPALRKRAEMLIEAVKSNKPESVRAMFRSDGFSCTDSVVPIDRVER